MAYDARKKEVLAELETLGYDASAQEDIKKLLETYFAQREGYLQNLLDALEPSDDARHRRWMDITQQGMHAALDVATRSERGKIFLGKFSSEEHNFFFNLHTCHVPSKRDDMVRMTKALGVAEKEFEEKWRYITEADEDIEERMHKIAEEYGEILNEAAKKAAENELSSKEETLKVIRRGLTGVLALVDLGVIEQILKRGASLLTTAISETKARQLEIHALLSRERGVFSTFLEGRDMVKKFLEDTSYPRVKDSYDAAEDAAEALPGNMKTPGQKDDASAFCSAIKSELQPVFGKAEDAYKAFARKHENLFFGPLGGGYCQELMEDDRWKEFSSDWREQKSDLDDILRDHYFKADPGSVLDVSLDGLSPENKKIVSEALQDDLQELLRKWNEFKEICKNPEWALQSREELKRILDAIR